MAEEKLVNHKVIFVTTVRIQTGERFNFNDVVDEAREKKLDGHDWSVKEKITVKTGSPFYPDNY